MGILAIIITVIGVTYAAFTDTGKVLGSTFSVGSADIKLLEDVTLGTESYNLVEELPGPNFDNISPFWVEDYLLKIFNNSANSVQISTTANYETINDPEDLRQIIFVEPIEWDDINNDGIFEPLTETGNSLGKKTIVKWKTEGFDLGTFGSGAVKSMILRFSTDEVSDTKQGASAIFDFEFDSMEIH